jgi:hypothetical protein
VLFSLGMFAVSPSSASTNGHLLAGIPLFLLGLEAMTPSQRINHLSAFLSANLTSDERIELYYLILREKCLLHFNPNDLTEDRARLVQHPYSPLAVAYKQLGVLCYEHYLLGHQDDLNTEARDQLLQRVDVALARLANSPIEENAKARFLAASGALRYLIEVQRHCPLIHLVRRCVDRSLNDLDLACSLTEGVDVIVVSIQMGAQGALSQIARGDLACIPREELSYSLLDERIVQLWYEWMGPPHPMGVDLLFNLHIQTGTNSWLRSFNSSLSL